MKLILALIALAATSGVLRAEEFQTYIEFRTVLEGAPNAGSGVRKLWRSGTRYARIEEPLDPRTGAESATIISEPDIYLVDLKSKAGRHVTDPDPNGEVHVPLYMGKSSATLMEAGREIQFFKANHAARLPDTDLEGVKCARFMLKIDGHELTLFIDLKNRVPRRVLIESPQGAYSIRYERYVRKQAFDAALYKPPVGFSPIKLNKSGMQTRAIDTPFSRLRAADRFFTAFDPVSETYLSGHLCRGLPVLLYAFDPAGELGSESVDHLKQLYDRYKRSGLCFVPMLSSPEAVPPPNIGFPVYKLLMFFDETSDPIEEFNRVHRKVLPVARVSYRDGSQFTHEIRAPGDFSNLDKRIEDAFDTRMARDEPETLDPAMEFEDRSEVQRRVEGTMQSEEFKRLSAKLEKNEFADVDKMFAGWRKGKTRGTNGSWMLHGAYGILTNKFGQEPEILKRMALMRQWIKSMPTSPTPRIALAKLWINYAWLGRSAVTADRLTERQRDLFVKRLKEAHQLLTQAKELEEPCPELYTNMITLGKGEGWPREEVDEVFRQGRTLEPNYQYLYEHMVNYLLPKWGGALGEWEYFLEKNVPAGPAGDEVYARVAILMSDGSDFAPNGEKLFVNSRLSWEKVRRGFLSILSTYPDKKMNPNFFAFMACAAGDRESARQAFALVGNDCAQSIWGNKVSCDYARHWANSSASSEKAAKAVKAGKATEVRERTGEWKAE